nr:uncharacterized protein LOC101745641 isoform X2 [Bombyx mori]
MAAQKELRDQIQNLEKRENAGIQLLKQADCMWTCMEDAYKKKVEDSLERQKTLLEELKEVETSATKWRKNKKDLESQLKNIEKCEKEIKEKINLKTNDLKCVNNEIDDFQKRIDKNKKEIDAATKSLTTKKQASDLKVANLASDIAKKQTVISDETKNKEKKERDGINFVKDAREDLQKLCRVLLQKRIENEDLRAERDALNLEIDLLNKSHDACQDKCAQKQQSILEEIKLTDQEIAKYKTKCVKCHQCTDTIDVRKYCTDCPRCSVERDCLYEDDKCRPDDTLDCVCMSVKEKLLDNIFDNMYTVLERQAKTEKGKAVGGAILKCLKKSRNGKLDAATRKLLQDFVLTTVKQHLNLTIVGGAVKTRCEMDPETHKQLMLCLKQVTVVGPPKEDKGTASKKESCRRWGGECNCPKGGKGCVCDKIAPPLPPEEPSIPEGVDNAETCKVSFCPRKTSTSCGPDVAMQAVPSRVGAEVAALKPDACKDSTCAYPKNMRAAQCVLGPEILNSPTKGSRLSVPFRPEIPVLDEKFCDCSISSVKSCVCRDAKKLKVVICEGCNKENCDILWERALKAVCPPFNEDSKLVHKNNDDVLLVSKDKNNVEEIVAEKNENHTNILEHIINLTSSKSGTLMTELDEKIIEFIENGINENKLAYVKNISPESIVVGFDDNDECVQNRSRISIRKTSSGSKYLEIRSAKNSVKSELNVKSNNLEKLVHSKSLSPERLTKTREKSSSCNFNKNYIKKLKKKSLDYKNRNNITKSAKKDDEKDSTQVNKLKIKISNKIIEAPAILKLTASQNFKVLMNKEYESWFSQQLKECIKNGTCKFKLHKTNSGNYLIDLDENDEANTRHLLKMTSSKSFKIVTDRENSKNKCESKECEDLSTQRSFDLHVKSKSDSKVYKKDKKVPDSQTLMQSSESLKKTPSGKLIVVLDKDTKTNLINNLKNYLVDCNGFVPVTKTESGEIIIDFNSNKSTLSKGSLKITASGNIYAIIDESLLKSADQNQRHNKNCIYSNIRGSEHLINKNRYPNNKSIATTCNGIPNESTCDVLKCVCHNLQCLAKNIEKHSEQGNICTPRKSFLNWTDVKTNDIRKARRSNLNTLKDYPHIVIKPNSNDSNVKSKEECFYVVETGCSFHKNRYVGVSNELLKISGPCNVIQDKTINRNDSKLLDQCKVIDDSYWDSLRYLPPQLPAFLKDVEYK